MKQLVYLAGRLAAVTGILFLAVLASSCEEDEKDRTNHLQYDGETYKLATGYIESYGQINSNPPSYNFDLTLYSEGLTPDDSRNGFTGEGHGLYVFFYSESSEMIAPGTYYFDDAASYSANTFDYAQVWIAFDAEEQTGELYQTAVDGEITVDFSGGEYEVDIDLELAGGEELTGFFKGSLVTY